MSVGRERTKDDIDRRAASVVEQVWSALEQAHQLSEWMANTDIITDDELTTLGYDPADIALLRAVANDLGAASGLWGVAHGQSHPGANNNFFFNGQKITSINFTG